MQPTSQDLRRSGACKDCHQRRCSKSMRLRYGTTLWPSTSDRGPTDAASRSSARLPEIRPVDRLGTRHSASNPPIPHSQCVDPYQLDSPRGTRFYRHIGLAAFKMSRDQGNKLCIRLAIGGRCFQPRSPRAVGLLCQQGAMGVGSYLDAKNHWTSQRWTNLVYPPVS
jgi:hypothetical protein